jgi:hypothetical protein
MILPSEAIEGAWYNEPVLAMQARLRRKCELGTPVYGNPDAPKHCTRSEEVECKYLAIVVVLLP